MPQSLATHRKTRARCQNQVSFFSQKNHDYACFHSKMKVGPTQNKKFE